MRRSKYPAILMSFFSIIRQKKKTRNGTLTGRTPPLPLNKHVNRWFNRWESPTRPKTRPALLRISSKLSAFFFWGMRLLPVLQTHQDKVQFRWRWATIQVCNGTTEPLNHFVPVKQIHEHFHEARMAAGLDHESGRFCFPSLGGSPQTHVGWVSIIHFYWDVRMLTATPQCFYGNWDEQEGASMLPEPPESRGIFWAPL